MGFVGAVELAEYKNVSRLIGSVLSQKLASMRDLDEWLSVEDCHDLLEVSLVDAHNRKLMQKDQDRN